MKPSFYQGRYLNDLDKKDLYIGEVKNSHNAFYIPEEVIKIHHVFFKKPYKNQRAVLRLLIWWSIKHYFKILFKK
jgi:hypothetical protein